MNRLLVSACCESRLASAWTQIAAASDVVIIGNTRTSVDDFLRLHCPAGKGQVGMERMTMGQFAARLAGPELMRQQLAPVSRLGREALAARAVYEARKAGELGYFEPVAETPGFAGALASTLDELRMSGVAASRLEGDLGRLLARYEGELLRGGLVDFAALVRLALHSDPYPFIGLPLLLLDVQPRLGLERTLVERAARSASSVIATAAFGDEESIGALEAMLGVSGEVEDSAGTGGLDRARRYIFSIAEPQGKASDDSVVFFSTPGEGLECAEIARRTLELARNGTPFDRVAVLVRDAGAYVSLLEDAFRRAEIPVYISGGTLRPDPAGRALLALLECAGEGLSASKFAEYLSLGQVPALDESGAAKTSDVRWAPSLDEFRSTPEVEDADVPEPPESDDWRVPAGSVPSPAGWEKLLVDAAVIGGYDRWERRLKGLEAEFRARISEVLEEDDSHVRRQLERLQRLTRFALPVIRRLHDLPERDTWGAWLPHLTGLARAALREPESVLGLLGELEPMQDVGPVGLDEVCIVLNSHLRFLRKPPAAKRFGSVFVGLIEEALSRPFDVVFLPGLAEGVFPRKPFEDPLLLDAARERLGAGLPTLRTKVARERLLLRIAAGSATRQLLASYPRLDQGQGRPRVPSFYALEITRAVEGALPDFRDLEHRAAVSTTPRLGWPAPANPLDAIDDSEHDLALLEPLLRKPPAETKGHARYLLGRNPHLARALRARYLRWKREWSSPDGVVTKDEASRAALHQHAFAERPYSASALQLYASCPYRFFLSAIQRLRPREDTAPLEQLDPLTRGAIFHAVQFRFFNAAREHSLLPFHEKRITWTLDLLDRVVNEVAQEFEELLAPAIERVWRTEIDNLRADLRAWVIDSLPEHVEWTPWKFEYSFGMAGGSEHDEASVAEPAILPGGLQLRGSIDVVESNGASLRVTDHKTGKAQSAPAYVGGGEVLQPVLYAMAAEVLFGKPVVAGRLYYCTQRGAYCREDVMLTPQARQHVERLMREIDRRIREGFLPSAPKKGACELCDYRPVCGPYEQERVRRKDAARLEELFQIRNMP